MSTRATRSTKNAASTSASQLRPSSTRRPSISLTPAAGTARIAFVSTGTRRVGSSSLPTPSGRAASESSQLGRPIVARFKITPEGALLKETPRSGAWIPTSPRVDLARLDATTDADINHQRIAELVDEALQVSMSSVAELAVALQLSPSTIRRWRRGAASPTAANLRRLRERLGLRS